ncbi:MAG: hypothetical protein H0X37_07195 [Herpetosiphonaceae bacterium]|nr:hypothetical protein [Herpetosiphonaceae bacterium]
MHVVGPETASDRARREWFEEQEKKNTDRLEDGAKTITTLVTGLYGVLFGVLALSTHPEFLKRPSVQWLGTAGVVVFFLALLAALTTTYPWPNLAQRDNVTEMEAAYTALVKRKVWSLSVALVAFVVGTLLLGCLISAVLWGW